MKTILPKGLIVEDPIIGQDYLGGTIDSLEVKYGAEVINPEGDWSPYTPSTEDQSTNTGDTFSCVSHGTNNAVEMIARLRFGDIKNLSDRFLARTSGTVVGQGNSPKRVADTLRHSWTVNESEWPDVNTVAEFYADPPENLRTLAIARGAEFEFGYQYIANSATTIKQALKQSPVCIAVTAWMEQNGVYVRVPGMAENHWVTIIKVLPNGNYWCFDSFPPFFKEVSPDACKSVAMSYYLNKNVPKGNEGLFAKFIKYIKSLLAQPAIAPVAPLVPPAPTPVSIPSVWKVEPVGDEKLIAALIQVESGGNDWAIGDRALANKAYGPLQIRQPYCDDVNRAFGTEHTAKRCLGDRKLSIDIFRKYMGIYATKTRLGREPTDEDKARMHNAGPTAWKPGNRMHTASAMYWSKVRRALQNV